MHRFLILLYCIAVTFLIACSSDDTSSEFKGESSRTLSFYGGPEGGTFITFANQMVALMERVNDSVTITVSSSCGSLNNLRALNSGEADMAIVYGGDAFLGRKGLLPGDNRRYERVRALAFLYGAPAHLVARKESCIESVWDLPGRKVAIGKPGSGTALAVERLLKHMGIWDEITIVNQGYAEAAKAFLSGELDAFWVLAGYPNASVIKAAAATSILLVDVYQSAHLSGLFEVYPFYSLAEIPPGTYDGQVKIAETFQDVALWCVAESVDEQTVYDALCAIYCESGLQRMIESHEVARDLDLQGGVRGASIPVHPGAARFWTERGVDIPPSLRPAK